jgi:uncharacterized protein YegJ (DUF2314 family)
MKTPASDPELEEAYRQARAGLAHFLAELKKDEPEKWYILKLRVEREGHVEYLWTEDVKETAQGFSGILINTPVEITSIKKGDRVTGGREAMVDWAIIRGDDREGGFTQTVLEKRR